MEKNLSWKKWEKQGDKHLINRIRWDKDEIEAVMKVFESDWFGHGEPNKLLEKRLSEYTGIPHFNLTNSGSSAILVAIKALIHQGRIKSGDKILHPISTFATSLSSALDFGLVPVFVETKPGTYVADPENVEKALKKYPEIKGMILPHILGNITDIEKIKEILGDRFLIEDCCDTMGGFFNEKHTGIHSDFMVFSFYGSHHITGAGGGGAIGTNDPELAKIAKSIIFWGRDFDIGDAFLDRYKYMTLGTNTQMPAILAAFALAQMGKLDSFVKEREKQFNEMHNIFKKYEDFFELPESHSKARPSWFSFPLIVKDNAPFTRADFVKHLSENHVEIRPIMCGNILKQAPFSKIKYHTIHDSFPIADKIERAGLFIPCWGMPEDQKIEYYKVLENFLRGFKNES